MVDMKDNGGPAFPSLNAEFTGIDSEGNDRFEIAPSGGLSMRDWFAGEALQGFLHNAEHYNLVDVPETARAAYKMADAMIEARKS